jgi:3-hydroxyisobutyrate dehydrogenase-like beta-hydroxyacid dehydrogenase
MSTVSPEKAQELAALHERAGSIYVEAPIFGRPEAAVARELWIPLAGPAQAKARVRPLLEAMGGKGIFDFGEAIGAAVMVKLAGNFLIISAARSINEALTIAGARGVDRQAVLDMLTQTLFPAPIYQSYGRRIAAGSASFAHNEIPLKDLGLLQSTARQVAAPAPIATMLRALLLRDDAAWAKE